MPGLAAISASDLPERPRLRPVEAFPTQIGDEQVTCLRDPANISDAVIGFSMEAIPILQALDGTQTILDIQVAETRRQGRIVLRSEIEDLVRALDERLFLLSPRFEAAHAALTDEFRQRPSRPPFHAGRAYPSDPEALRQWLDSFFAHPDGPGAIDSAAPSAPIAGILAPHIDFQRGGPVYAWAYRALAEAEPADLYIVLGVPHQGIEGPAAATLKAYDTPLGALEVDHDFVESLQRRAGIDLLQEELGHRTEHSIEFETVFLRYLLGDREIRIVPLLTSFVHELMAEGKNPRDDPESQRFISALGETIAAYPGRVCIVGGVDLAHVGPQFGDPDAVTPQTLDWLASEDQAMLSAVEAGDADAFFEAVAKDGDRRRVCGLTPIYTVLQVLGREGKLLKYGQAPDPNGTVTFASVVF
jgi:AmmeMemoRadiSam system protein B